MAVYSVLYYVYAFFLMTTESNVNTLFFSGLVASIFVFALLYLHKSPYIFDPIVLFGFTVFISLVLKVAYLCYKSDQLYFLLAGRGVGIFVDAVITMTWAVALMILAYYLVVQPGNNRPTKYYHVRWSHKLVLFLLVIIAVVSTIASLMVVSSIGLTALVENFSAKRFNDVEGASGRLSTSLYIYFRLALTARIGLYLAVAYLISCKDVRNKQLVWVLLLLLFVLSLFVPTMFSARAQAILTVLDIALILFASGYTIRMTYVLTVLAIGYGFLTYTAFSRSGGVEYKSATDSIMGARYLMDMTKTAHIFEYFQERGSWFYGETLYGWLFVPVPESIMPNKPMFVDIGKWIGYNVFGYEISGVPPGYIGELFLNFGIPGVVAGMIAIGAFMGMFWRWFIKRIRHPIVMVFGSMVVSRFAVILFNNDLGTFFIKLFLESIPAVIIIYLCTSIRPLTQQSGRKRPNLAYPRPAYAPMVNRPL